MVYALTAETGLAGADNGEFVTLAFSEGTAHPPGYPLYTIYLRAMSWLPASTPAHATALATALLGAATVATLTAALQRWGTGPVAAATAALVVGFDAQVWLLATHAEVFTLNALVAAGILWAAAPGNPRRGIARAATLGLLAGLALSNHHTSVFLLPLGLYGLAIAGDEARESETPARSMLLACGAASTAGIVGLLPYAYLVASAGDCGSCLGWGDPSTFDGLWHLVTRADYGTTSLSAKGEAAGLANLSALLQALVVGSAGIVALFAVAGMAVAVRDRRVPLVAIATSWFLAGPVFVSLFNIAPTGIGQEIVARFYVLPIVLLAPFVALGLQLAGRVVAVAAVCIALLASASTVTTTYSGLIGDYAHDLLAPLPADAIVLGTGDHRMFGVHYQQLVEGHRTDVVYIDAYLLAYDWYRARLEERLGAPLPASTADSIPLVAVVDALAALERPLFLSHRFDPLLARYPSYPFGVTVRLTAREAVPHPAELAKINATVFDEFRVQKGPLSRSAWEKEVTDHYAGTWLSLADALQRSGDAEGANHARNIAKTLERELPR